MIYTVLLGPFCLYMLCQEWWLPLSALLCQEWWLPLSCSSGRTLSYSQQGSNSSIKPPVITIIIGIKGRWCKSIVQFMRLVTMFVQHMLITRHISNNTVRQKCMATFLLKVLFVKIFYSIYFNKTCLYGSSLTLRRQKLRRTLLLVSETKQKLII